MSRLHIGSQVVLRVPENPRLDGARGRVVVLTEWGGHVSTNAAATGVFRALYSEMEPLDGGRGGRVAAVDWAEEGTESDTVEMSAAELGVLRAREEGYTGDACDMCGSFSVKRAGKCLTCCECGASGGCG